MKLAIFDFDGTLFTRETLPCLGKEWIRQKRSVLRYLLTYLSVIPFVFLYRAGIINRDRLKVAAMAKFHRLFKGMNQEENAAFFKQSYVYLQEYFNLQILKEIKAAKEEGFHTVLLSGAYANLLRVVAEGLGIDSVIGAEIPFKDGIIDHRQGVPFIDGKVKLSMLQEAFSRQEVQWEKCRSYADSITDLPVLMIAGEPVAVNPDPELLDYAKRNNWRLLNSKMKDYL